MVRNIDKPFSEIVRDYRKKHNLTQAQLGALVGVKWRTVARWEAGRSRPNIEAIMRNIEQLDPPIPK